MKHVIVFPPSLMVVTVASYINIFFFNIFFFLHQYFFFCFRAERVEFFGFFCFFLCTLRHGDGCGTRACSPGSARGGYSLVRPHSVQSARFHRL